MKKLYFIVPVIIIGFLILVRYKIINVNSVPLNQLANLIP